MMSDEDEMTPEEKRASMVEGIIAAPAEAVEKIYEEMGGSLAKSAGRAIGAAAGVAVGGPVGGARCPVRTRPSPRRGDLLQ